MSLFSSLSKSVSFSFLIFALTVGCGGDDDGENNGVNNGSGNNGSGNNGSGNNGSGNNGAGNNGSGNNGSSTTGPGSNNGGSNNTTGNNGTMGACVDADGDSWFVDCDDYAGIEGPDCDDADVNNWESCATCTDGDGDDYFASCDAYMTIDGPDCDDTDGMINPGAAEIQGNGIDEDCNGNGNDACMYTPVPANDPEPGFNAGITAAHNYWRWRVGLPPMFWNPALAASAKAYAEQCIWEHDSGRSPDAGFTYVGENLYATSVQPSSASVLQSVQSWADEREFYDFGEQTGQSQGGVVGHYTQIVWDDSVEVGCDWARCNNPSGLQFAATLVVCRYGPGGNYTGRTPYDFTDGACLDLDNDDILQSVDVDDTVRN